jgi:FAD/FMN-containing dehydrogenase
MTQAVVAALLAALPDGTVLPPEAVRARARNYWDPAPLEAAALVRPSSTEQVATVLRICHDHRQSVVPHGGLTGVCDGDRATGADVILSLERMNEIEDIDLFGRTLQAQAGCTLQAAQQAVAAAGLLLPLDLGARGSCTLGGNVSTNAGGLNVIRYGMTRSLVLGLEAVLADGTVLSSLTRMLKNNTGYDLKQLFIGSEGTLGIVTRVVFALEESSSTTNTALVALPGGDAVRQLLAHMRQALGSTLSSYEVMWREYYEAVTSADAQAAPIPPVHPFYALVETHGCDANVDDARFAAALDRAAERGLIVDAVLPKSRAERDRLWKVREDFSAIYRQPPVLTYDVSLPIRNMFTYVDEVSCRLRGRWPGGRLYVMGHVGDGNLHLFACPGLIDPVEHRLVDQMVYEPLPRVDGSISAEHGIGLTKLSWLPLSRSSAELATMRLLKRTLDPHGILNPGKVVAA